MAFVVFKLPFSNQITLWKGAISPTPKVFEENDEKKFLIGKYNNKNEVFELNVHEEFTNENINYDELLFHFTNEQPKNLNKTEFCQLIQNAVNTLKNNDVFKKVVLSRVETFNGKIDIIQSFKNLCKKYPNAFVHLISSPETGTWLGASPEKFLQLNNNQLSTVALAGTLNKNKNSEWTDKEKKEQKWVEVHIEDVLEDAQAKYIKTGPKNLKIGHLEHLITEYEAAYENNLDIRNILKKLNPTPAVCGIPAFEANKFIVNNEGYSRNFYSGILGPYMNKNTFDLFVNLRCLQITKDAIIQYAGAGITSDSNPENEWEETGNKIEMTRSLLEFN